jgi:DHA1 family tetracycline resistance protein-like MFS transporter
MKEKDQKKVLFTILFTIFVDILGFGILIPVIPLLLADPSSSYFLLPKSISPANGYILLGFLLAIFPFMQFLATPILGQLSDKFGRKKILSISLLGTSISYIFFAFGIITRNIPLLFISRGFDGITGGNISVAQAAIADITPPEKRAQTFGLIGAVFGFGFIIGPFLGGKLSDPTLVSWFSASTPFWFAAILSMLNVLFVSIYLKETHAKLHVEKVIEWTRSIHNVVKAYAMKELRVIFITNFLIAAGFTFFTSFFSVYLITKFHFNQGNIGDFFAYLGIWIAFTQAVLTGYFGKKYTDIQILKVSIITMGFLVLAYFLPTVWWQLLLVVPFFALFNGLTMANSTALVSKTASSAHQGEVLGINSSVQALAQAIPAALSGYIAAQLTPESPIFVASVFIVIAGLIFIFFYKPKTT